MARRSEEREEGRRSEKGGEGDVRQGAVAETKGEEKSRRRAGWPAEGRAPLYRVTTVPRLTVLVALAVLGLLAADLVELLLGVVRLQTRR